MRIKLLVVACLVLGVALAICLVHIWREQKAYARFGSREVAWFTQEMANSPGISDPAIIYIRKTPDGFGLAGPFSHGLIPAEKCEDWLASLEGWGLDRVVVYADREISVGQLTEAGRLLRVHGIDKLFINGGFECRLSAWLTEPVHEPPRTAADEFLSGTNAGPGMPLE